MSNTPPGFSCGSGLVRALGPFALNASCLREVINESRQRRPSSLQNTAPRVAARADQCKPRPFHISRSTSLVPSLAITYIPARQHTCLY
ncbi:hypothetical protein V2G26_003229 [Clonostachys chloroleuca]